MKIVETTVADKIEQVGKLLMAHWDELATNHELMELKPAVEKYAAMEKAGVLFSLCAYEGSEIVGYSVNTFGPNLHYSNLIVSMNDVLFLSKPFRNAKFGGALMAATEQAAKARSAGMHIWHAKPNTALDSLLASSHYTVQDILYSKVL